MEQTGTTKPRPHKSYFIPVHPVPASRPRVTRWGTYYGKNYTAWRKEVESYFASICLTHAPFDQPVKIALEHIVVKPRTSKRFWPRGDLDNYAKAVLDSLVKGKVLADDDYVLQLHAYKRFAEPNEQEGTRIVITLLNDGTEKT